MKSVSSLLIAAVTATSLVVPVSVATSTASMAAPRGFCEDWAAHKADKKVNGKVLGNAIVGVGLGALAGAVIGGKHAVTKGAAIGGGAGLIGTGMGSNKKWKKTYWKYYTYCREEM